MWGNLRGVSEQAQEALKHISYEEDVWEDIGHSLLRMFHHDGRADEGIVLLQDLSQRHFLNFSKDLLSDVLNVS